MAGTHWSNELPAILSPAQTTSKSHRIANPFYDPSKVAPSQKMTKSGNSKSPRRSARLQEKQNALLSTAAMPAKKRIRLTVGNSHENLALDNSVFNQAGFPKYGDLHISTPKSGVGKYLSDVETNALFHVDEYTSNERSLASTQEDGYLSDAESRKFTQDSGYLSHNGFSTLIHDDGYLGDDEFRSPFQKSGSLSDASSLVYSQHESSRSSTSSSPQGLPTSHSYAQPLTSATDDELEFRRSISPFTLGLSPGAMRAISRASRASTRLVDVDDQFAAFRWPAPAPIHTAAERAAYAMYIEEKEKRCTKWYKKWERSKRGREQKRKADNNRVMGRGLWLDGEGKVVGKKHL